MGEPTRITLKSEEEDNSASGAEEGEPRGDVSATEAGRGVAGMGEGEGEAGGDDPTTDARRGVAGMDHWAGEAGGGDSATGAGVGEPTRITLMSKEEDNVASTSEEGEPRGDVSTTDARRGVAGTGEGEGEATGDDPAARTQEGEAARGVNGKLEGEATRENAAATATGAGAGGGLCSVPSGREAGTRTFGAEAATTTPTATGGQRAKEPASADKKAPADAEATSSAASGSGGRRVSGILDGPENWGQLSDGVSGISMSVDCEGRRSLSGLVGGASATGGAKDSIERGLNEYPALCKTA